MDHPQLVLDSLAEIVLETGTDKYDPNRKGVAHEEFEPYRADFQPDLAPSEKTAREKDRYHQKIL